MEKYLYKFVDNQGCFWSCEAQTMNEALNQFNSVHPMGGKFYILYCFHMMGVIANGTNTFGVMWTPIN